MYVHVAYTIERVLNPPPFPLFFIKINKKQGVENEGVDGLKGVPTYLPTLLRYLGLRYN